MNRCAQIYAFVFGIAVALCARTAVAELTVSLSPPEGPMRPGEAAPFVVSLSGVEPGQSYTLLPPASGSEPSLDWATITWGGVTVSGAEPQFQLSLSITAAEPGDFELPALQVRALPIAAQAPMPGEALAEAEPLVVATKPMTVQVRKDFTPLYFSLGAGVLALMAVALVALTWRRGRGEQSDDAIEGTPREQAREHLHHARRHRLDGNFYEFYRSLSAAARALEQEGGQASWSPRLDARAQDVGYRGVRPTEDEMDGAMKDLEQALTQRKEDK